MVKEAIVYSFVEEAFLGGQIVLEMAVALLADSLKTEYLLGERSILCFFDLRLLVDCSHRVSHCALSVAELLLATAISKFRSCV